MITQLFRSTQEHSFERTYPAPVTQVWRAWTDPDLLRQWWGPENTTVPECEVDLRVGGRLWIVMQAGEGMGKYAGTRWPLEGTFTKIDAPHSLIYDARSWTEGEEASSIVHTNEVQLTDQGPTTLVRLEIHVREIGSGVRSKLAAYGMKWGYKAQLDKLESLLASPLTET